MLTTTKGILAANPEPVKHLRRAPRLCLFVQPRTAKEATTLHDANLRIIAEDNGGG